MMFDTVIEKESKREYEVKASKTGENLQPCPVCSEDRKKKKAPCFSYNSDKGIGHCSHCGITVYRKDENQKTYARPVWENRTNLSEKVVDWFLQRNISQDTLIAMKVTDGVEWMPQVQKERNVICFNYFRDGQLINIKYRDGAKNFKMVKDAEKIFYNLDGIKGVKEAYIVEGEIDCLTMVQAGYTNTVSVPNGATKGANNLDYLNACWQYFENLERVYILTDHDEPGENLANELARRVGVEKAFRIALDGFKDVNEQLCQSGAVNVSKAIPWPVTGIYSVEDHWGDVMSILRDGFPKGWQPRGKLGELISFHPGYTTVITGIPGHGKSEELDQILVQLCIDYGVPGGYFTPENWPTSVHILKLIEKTMGKSAFKCSEMELRKGKEFLQSCMHWIYPEEGYSLETILSKVRQGVLKYGIRWYVIDPWNKLEHKRNGLSETDYVSMCLDLISTFNKKNGTHCFLVAHPTKMKFNDSTGKYEIPGLYDISGSANWYNKADIGLSMYRNADASSTENFGPTNTLYVQKVKFKFWGGTGQVDYNWNSENGRYSETVPDYTYWIRQNSTPTVIDFSAPAFDPDEPAPF